MMNEKKLADVLEITSSRRIFACDYCEYGIPFFRGKEITEKYLGNDKISTELFISRKKFNDIKIKFGVPCDGDILLTSVGTLGSVYQVKKGDEFYFKDGNITWFKNFSDDINSKFVYYWLISRDTQNKLNKIAIGTTQKALTIVNLRNIIIKYPSLYEQNFIVHILETLDDKIKLNRRQNTTLEAMAQAIFKEWFVDFGPVRAKMEGRQPEGISREIADLFPDRLDDEGKPEGWERKKLGDLITFYSERIKSDKLTESNYVSTENMLSDKKGITKASSLPTTDSVPAFCTGHILVSNIRPYFKKIWFATFDGGRSNDVLDFCPSIVGTNYFIFNILICDAFFNFMMQTAKGSKMPRGDKNAIMAYPVVAPTEVLQRAYSSLVEVYYKKININVLKNEVLTSLRDTLLPKLISGELRVPDAEKMVADIV
ncbi:restriction endonuclease subunit S [Bilophila wadsworthia]|uniref:restriction endonuclease subunit S n=1 Tax=Bilophila wadsworthia TaxID=35833 RepID=UPI000AB30C37|nr:restriction endonuclease subunit S [Bilophila wadsworthia]